MWHFNHFVHPFLSLFFLQKKHSTCSAGSPVVVSQDTWVGDEYLAEWALLPTCNAGTKAFWVGPQRTEGAGFVADYGGEASPVEADGFYLRNSKNGNNRDRWAKVTSSFFACHLEKCFFPTHRATIDFLIEVSLDQLQWKVAVESFFPGPVPPESDCEPTLFFPVNSAAPVRFRYLKFTALTYYEKGASLQYISPRESGKKTSLCRSLIFFCASFYV